MRQATYRLTTLESATSVGQTTVYVWRTKPRSVHYDMTGGKPTTMVLVRNYNFPRVEGLSQLLRCLLRGGVKLQTAKCVRRLPSPTAKQTTERPCLAQGNEVAGARALQLLRLQ